MKIEIWSDYVCPFCYIGKRKFEAALEAFPQKNDVDIEFKSFQLDPNASKYDGQNYYESLAEKFGSIEQAKQVAKNVAAQAEAVGLAFHFDTMKPTNTFDAHRLTHFAKKHGMDSLLTESLLSAHFLEGKDVGDIATLIEIATAVGLDEKEVTDVLQNVDNYKNDVKGDIALAGHFGVTGVPFFIFNRKYAVSGAQPEHVFTQTLEKAWEEQQQDEE